MPKLTVRALDENEWVLYRDVRLAALQESPAAFVEPYEREQQYDDAHWRGQLRESRPLVLEREDQVVGVATMRLLDDEPGAADVSGLWVDPEARHTGAALKLIEAAASLAEQAGASKIFYWVGSENGRAIGFALNAGFRPTSRRRTAPTADPEFGDQEIALVLSLANDPAAIPNASSRSLRHTG
jgi:ribosomal protein S18 acetylase RimI-like enzyme